MKEKIRQLRKQLNLSQTQFAERLGITYSTISLIESGKIHLTESLLKLICLTFRVNMSWMRNGIGPIFTDTNDRQELLNIAQGMNPAMLNVYIDIGKDLLKYKEVSQEKEGEPGQMVHIPNPDNDKSRKNWHIDINQSIDSIAANDKEPIVGELGDPCQVRDFGVLSQGCYYNEMNHQYYLQFFFEPKQTKWPLSIKVNFTTRIDGKPNFMEMAYTPDSIESISSDQKSFDLSKGIIIDSVDINPKEVSNE